MAPVVITKLRDMLCRCVLCYAFPECCAARIVGEMIGRIRGSLREMCW